MGLLKPEIVVQFPQSSESIVLPQDESHLELEEEKFALRIQQRDNFWLTTEVFLNSIQFPTGKDPIRSDKPNKLQGLARSADLHSCLNLREGKESLLFAIFLATGKARKLLSDI